MDAIQVVGAGGIGCAVGYALRAAGVPVVFVDANRAKGEAGRRDGVRVDDRPPLPVEFVHFADWQPGPGAPVLLCTKCYDNATVLAKLPPGVRLFPIQNGFDTRLDAFEGIASFVSECATDAPHTRIIRLGKVGPFHPRTVASILRRKWLAGLMAKFFEPSLRETYCSMAGEVQKGRTEIDNYNGHLIRLAEQAGVPCPLNRAVFDLVTKMTATRAESKLEALQSLASSASYRSPFAAT